MLIFCVADTFLPNNARSSYLTTTAFGRNRAHEQNDSNTNYNYQNDRQWSNFKQPMPPPITNGAKRLPGLISANRSFGRPQQTVNPHYDRFGGTSELANFKSVPELYPIQNVSRSNATSYSTGGNLVNGHDYPSMFSSSKYGSVNHESTDSLHRLATPQFRASGTHFNNSNTKPGRLTSSQIFSGVS